MTQAQSNKMSDKVIKKLHVECATAIITEDGGIVCNQVCSEYYAQRMVNAFNTHADLVAALEVCAKLLANLADSGAPLDIDGEIQMAAKALAKAKAGA